MNAPSQDMNICPKCSCEYLSHVENCADCGTTLLTAGDGSGEACRVVVHGGTIRKVEPAAGPRGTTLEVRNLFFNTPARRKFLRSEATETQRIVEFLTNIALSRPEVRFELRTPSRSLLSAPPASSLRLMSLVSFSVGSTIICTLRNIGILMRCRFASIQALSSALVGHISRARFARWILISRVCLYSLKRTSYTSP